MSRDFAEFIPRTLRAISSVKVKCNIFIFNKLLNQNSELDITREGFDIFEFLLASLSWYVFGREYTSEAVSHFLSFFPAELTPELLYVRETGHQFLRTGIPAPLNSALVRLGKKVRQAPKTSALISIISHAVTSHHEDTPYRLIPSLEQCRLYGGNFKTRRLAICEIADALEQSRLARVQARLIAVQGTPPGVRKATSLARQDLISQVEVLGATINLMRLRFSDHWELCKTFETVFEDAEDQVDTIQGLFAADHNDVLAILQKL